VSNNTTTKSINLSNCECISQDDKEIFVNIIDDAIYRREELHKSRTKLTTRHIDQELLKSYELFSELVQNFKTCRNV
jgi:hypothetical protein